jgi:hypothetical protein
MKTMHANVQAGQVIGAVATTYHEPVRSTAGGSAEVA